MIIIWTSEALETFDSIINYLEKEFSQKQVDNFYFMCDEIIDLIKEDPFHYKPSNKKSIRKAVLHKYTTLYYQIDLQNDSIILLSFFETRQNPNKKLFNQL